MEASDPLADDVQIRGPQPLVPGVGEARSREIVDERIEPHVHRLLLVIGEGDAPRQPHPRDRNVLEAALEETQHFVAADRRIDGELAAGDERQHAVAVGAEPEEMVALLGRHQLERRMLDAMAVHDLRAGLELLAPRAVQPLIVGDEQVVGTALLNAPQQRRDPAHVARLGRADPIVVAAVQASPEIREQVGQTCGVTPPRAAAWITDWLCSSIPMRKCTVSPRSRR